MALPTFTSARDEIFGLFKTAWDSLTPAVNGGQVPRVEWDGVDAGSPPPTNAAWARIRIEHTISEQSTFADPGFRRFTNYGFVTVQIFKPHSAGAGLTLGENLAKIARGAFLGVGTSSGIWFRNVTITEAGVDTQLSRTANIHAAGSDKIWSRINVRAEFQYDEED